MVEKFFGQRSRKRNAFLLLLIFSLAQELSSQALVQSRKLAALASQIEQGDSTAIARFWMEAAEQGMPLVEPMEGDDEDVLVTFLFRGGEATKNVVIMADRGLWGDISSNRMERLASTDVWYRTYRFRKDARFTYSFSVNDPLTPLGGIQDAEEWLERSAHWRADPLNPRWFPAYPQRLSVVELPGAPAQPWVAARPEVEKGLVQTHKLRSQILSNERTIWVYTPPGYQASQAPNGLLILFDGGAYNGWVPTPTILDNLISERRIPPLVAALISHPGLSARNSELTCSDAFTQFLAEELMPWLRKSYRITEDPALAVIGGSSNGGLGAAFAAFRHPEIFGNVLSQSGAFMYSPTEESEPEWLIRQFAASPRLPLRFHLDCGLMEAQPTDGAVPNIVMANRHMRDVLLAKGYRVHYLEFNGGHEYINWRGTLADGLIALLGNRPAIGR